MDEKYISEENPSHQNTVQIIDHTLDDNRLTLVNTEEEVDVASIHSINITNDIYMNDDDNYIHKYYLPYLSSNNNGDIFSET